MWKFFHLERVLREDGLLVPGQCYRPSIPPLDWIEMVRVGILSGAEAGVTHHHRMTSRGNDHGLPAACMSSPHACFMHGLVRLQVHDRDYLHGFLHNSHEKEVMRRIGFQHSPELVERTLLEVGRLAG